MNDYEKRQQDRKERYLARAEDARRHSDDLCGRAMDRLPDNGQPILVGHYSEGRHRNAIRKSDNDMRKAVEESKKAQHYADKAASVGKGGVSSDDPAALEKLREQLAAAKENQEAMKRANAAWRKVSHGKRRRDMSDEQFKACLDTLPADLPKELRTHLRLMQDYDSAPFPAYALSNNNANAKRIERRIKELEKRQERAAAASENGDAIGASEDGSDWSYQESFDANRHQITFDAKPEKETRDKLRSCGFLWSPTNGAWQRKLGGNSAWAVRAVLSYLRER